MEMEKAMRKATLPSVRQGRARASAYRPDVESVSERIQREYERGCRWATFALCGMFAIMALGAVFLGW